MATTKLKTKKLIEYFFPSLAPAGALTLHSTKLFLSYPFEAILTFNLPNIYKNKNILTLILSFIKVKKGEGKVGYRQAKYRKLPKDIKIYISLR